MSSKKFVIITLISTITIFVLLSSFVIIIDPCFHYHKPIKHLTYTLDNQRYQNDGIVKHFDYNAIITGTSMTENFKVSEFNKLFNVNSIKIPFEGAMFKEINDNLITATNYNDNIKIILRCLDLYKLNKPKNAIAYDTYPTYLYDNNIFNDIEYLLNKDIIINSINFLKQTIDNENSTTFDDYSAWYKYTGVEFSKDMVDSQYIRSSKKKKNRIITKKDYITIKNNIEQNVTNLADKYPNIDFYLFYPPYSIYYWDNLNQNGDLNKELDYIEYTTKLLLEHKNIHLYSFLDEYEIITNLNNYKDTEHYSEKINSIMLQKMANNEKIINKDNYKSKINDIREFYTNYNYDKLFSN